MNVLVHQEAFAESLRQFEADPDTVRVTLTRRIPESLFARYQSKVVYDQKELGVFGYGSLQFARDAVTFGDNTTGVALTVGTMSENALGCSILLGGEHVNDGVFNHTLSVYPDLLRTAQQQNTARRFHRSLGPVKIGSNVVVSLNCTIRSGVTIGDGAVIGAGAVVTRDVPPFAVVGGNKAEVLRLRFSETVIESLLKLRWWDFTPESLVKALPLIDRLPEAEALAELLEMAPNCWRAPSRNYLLFAAVTRPDGSRPLACVGAEIDGKTRALEALPDAFQCYVKQIHNPPGTPCYLVKNIFQFCGLGV